MTTITAVDSGSSHQSARKLWWSAGVHAAILLLCLVISTIPPTTASAIERPRVTLIAPTPSIISPRVKNIAAKLAAAEPSVKTTAVELTPAPATPPREFIAPARQLIEPPRASQVEIASLQSIEVAPVIHLTEPSSTRELPPPPIVVGKLSGATTSNAPAQSGIVTTRAGFSASSGNTTTPEPKQARASSFEGATIANTPAPHMATKNTNLTRSIEIIKKPQPTYTEEARALRLEGEVLLEVLFTASAEVRVLRVTRGLGHGLDEAAVASASRIEFRPALREGEPTDQTVTVHIRFQLAY